MLILAREAEGFTIRELSEMVGTSSPTISRYESGLYPVPDEYVAEMAKVLDRPPCYFYREGRIYPASGLFHRKRKKISVAELKRIDATVNELRLRAEALLRYAEVESSNRFYRLDQDEYGGPAGVAKELRRLWQLPTGPIRSVVDAIESAGGVVFRHRFRNLDVDGISQWPLDASDMPPVFFVNEGFSGDRERFTLSHEVGHVVMHHLPSRDIEVEADQFASEFLMPADEIAPELHDLTLSRAADLKVYWRVSMQAIVRRARDLRRISEREYMNLYKRMSALGYRKCEPVPIPAEEPSLYGDMIGLHRTYFHRSDEELSGLVAMTVRQFQSQHGAGSTGLRVAAV